MEKRKVEGENSSTPENLEEDHKDSPDKTKRMKYFRKANLFQRKDAIRSLIKKNYCLEALSMSIIFERARVIKRLFQSRKFLSNICFFSPRLSIKRGTNPKYFKRFEQTINTQCAMIDFLCLAPRFSGLQKLGLKLNLASGNSDDEVALIIKSLGKGLGELRRLELVFGASTIYNKETTIQSFVKHIGKNLKNLKHLDLKFKWYNFTNEQVQVLVKHIDQNLKSLQSLSLSFKDCPRVTHVGLQTLATQLGTSLPSLQALKILLASGTKIPAKEIENLIQRIGINLPKLQRLNLDFSNCDEFTNEGVQFLATQMGSHLKRLTHLWLALPYCRGPPNQGVAYVAKNIMTQLTLLECLFLDLGKVTTLTDDGIKALAEEIWNLKELKQLHFGFKGCVNVTKTGVKTLAREVQSHLKMLQEFSLVTSCLNAFGRPETITDVAKILKS